MIYAVYEYIPYSCMVEWLNMELGGPPHSLQKSPIMED